MHYLLGRATFVQIFVCCNYHANFISFFLLQHFEHALHKWPSLVECNPCHYTTAHSLCVYNKLMRQYN